MASPFKKPSTVEPWRKRLWDTVTRTRDAEDDAEEVKGAARSVMEWVRMPYHMKFIAYLHKEADAPVEMTDQFKMIAGTARANTFKEVLLHIDREMKRSTIALGDTNG